MKSGDFFTELKRRNVYKVAAAYAVIAWLLIQAASILFPTFEAPSWVMKAFVVIVAAGFVLALIIAWAFELTPEGIRRTEDVSAPRPGRRSQAWIFIVVVGAVLSVGMFFLGRYGFRPASPSEGELPRKSIAVLPFDNLSRDPDNAFFAEGVQDEILTRLAKVADLKVIARTSTQKFKSAPENLPEIARQLGVMNILEGSVQKSNDQVRVNVQLINAMTSAHLWAEIYDRKLSDIFAVQSDIAKSVADTLQAKLSGAEKQMMTAPPTTDMAAYELYSKGRSFWRKRSGDNLPQAIAFYEQAIARDPKYALAYAALSEAYGVLPYYTAIPRRDAFVKAKEAALKALQLDPNLGEAHAAYGKILGFHEIDLHASIPEFQRAIELEPNNATAHHWYGNGPLVALSRFEEGIAENRRAAELDPLSPVIHTDLGQSIYYGHRFSEAVAQLQKAVALDPTFFYSRYSLGEALLANGDLSGALSEFEKAKQLSDDPFILALVAVCKTKLGDKNIAQQTLAELDQIAQHREVTAYSRSLLYLCLNNRDEALRWLEQSYAERDGANISYIKVDPLLDLLHGDPRFEALVQKVVAPKS